MKSKVLSIFCYVILCLRITPASAQDQFNIDPSAENKINELIKKMTLEEKVGMLHANSSFTSAGVPRLGIPEFTTSDGPHGVRPEHGRDWVLDNKGGDSSTYLPVGITLASTWNPDLGYAFGAVLGREASYRGKDVILGPGVNIIRTPLNGRNFEYMSEDPYLISKMAVGYIKGVQDQGVSASLKHFIANNQEIMRSGINVEMSDRALREIYLPAFRAAVVEGGVNTVMGSYNKFRGEYCTYSDLLVNKILKGEWGFKGLVMSDWGAIHHTKEALLGGADLEMGTDLSMLPNPDFSKFYFADAALRLLKTGEINESVIDDKVRRILRVMFKTHMFEERPQGAHANQEHADLALKVAEEGIILLKNAGVLPLNKSSIKTIAVIGANANREHAMGGGSSQVRPRYEITPLKGLQNIAGNDIGVVFEQGYAIKKNAVADKDLIHKAVEAARKADVAVVVGGWIHGYDYSKWDDNAYDTEGFDKPDLKMPFGQDELIKAVIKANPNTVVILYGGGAIDMTAWVKGAKAVVQAGYPGMEGGNALAKILFGEVNPSGKLTVTFPRRLEDIPAHKFGEYPGDSINVRYSEDIFVGYRYFDTHKVKPLFSFGHGLSYTSYHYGKAVVSTSDTSATVRFVLKNTGDKSGAETIQVYVADRKASLKRPAKELKAFQKIFLQPGESREVELHLDKSAFSFYDDKRGRWLLEPGKFDILIGSSSADIRLKNRIKL